MVDGTCVTPRNEPMDDPGRELVQLFGRMMLLPVSALVYSMEAFLRSLEELRSLMDLGVQAMASYAAPPVQVVNGGDGKDFFRNQAGAAPVERETEATTLARRTVEIMDTNMSDDMVKLVRFTIVTIKRDDEHVLGEGKGPDDEDSPAPPRYRIARGEKIVTENMTDDSFSAWVISEYFQKDHHEPVDADDKKYLRVYHEVLKRWAKQDRKFEKNQLESLAGIEDALKKIAAKPC
jgi:hypothetical protein